MYTGNPHQDQRGRNSFTSGWKSGWSDFKNNIRDLQGPMNPGGQLPRPNPWNGKPFPKGQEPNHMIPLASIDTTPDSGSEYWGDDYYFPTDYIYRDTSDMYKDNPMRDDYYVQDPFSDIWGGQGGPLSFS